MKCYASKVIEIAYGEVGMTEKKSNSNLYDKTANAGYNNYNKYAYEFDTKYPNFYNGKKNPAEWCDIWHDWCHVKAFGVENALRLLGQPLKSCGAGCSWSANYYKQIGRFYKTPKPGDQVFFKDSSGEPCHTGLVTKVTDTKIYTIEGNTSSKKGVVANGGCVAEKCYNINYYKIYGYGRPLYDPEPKKSTSKPTTTKKGVCIVEVKELHKGSDGKQVRALQTLLIGYGYSCGKSGVDGDFGTNTEKAVKKYQKAVGLADDGVVGTNTWNKLLGVK
jgi:hypothetical protein